MSLSAEIQRQLLPTAAACEAPQFTLAAALVPASDIAGDTYDYSLDAGTLHLSITDAMGHGVGASLMATLLVSASRGARRAGEDLAEPVERHAVERGINRLKRHRAVAVRYEATFLVAAINEWL